MLAAIINLAHALGLEALAQGVDSEAQLDVLAAFGCDKFQGAQCSARLDAAALLPLLQQGRLRAPDNDTTPKLRGQRR
jgi:EAL domain-containing protein (putative c-di-GMP-specific phosphodiesterase class I)